MLDAAAVTFFHRWPVGLLLGVGVALVMACGSSNPDDNQFREDVIWCEEAVAHLEECCGAIFDPSQIECRHYYEKNVGCESTTYTSVDPAFTTDQSRCIHEQSCDVIVANKICERALAAGKARSSVITIDDRVSSSGAVSSSSSSTSGSAPPAPICP